MPIKVRCLGADGWEDVEVECDPGSATLGTVRELLEERLGCSLAHPLLSAGPRHLADESDTLSAILSGDAATVAHGDAEVVLTNFSDLLDGSIYGEAVKRVGAPPRKTSREQEMGVAMTLRHLEPLYGYVEGCGFFPRCPKPKRQLRADDPLDFINHFDSFESAWGPLGLGQSQPPETKTCPCRIADTAHRGISLVQLRTLLAFVRRRCRSDGKVEGWVDMFPGSPSYRQPLQYEAINLYQATDWIIRPATRSLRCSYVELVAKSAEEQVPKWFVSHAWAESVLRFVVCVERHFDLRGLQESDCVWVCAYANNQHELGAELVRDPRQTSFFRAMRLCAGVLLILDEHATPFRRIWCCFEEAVALSDQEREAPMLLDIATVREGRAEHLCDGPSQRDVLVGRAGGPGSEWTQKAEREQHFELDFVVRSIPSIDIEAADASQEIDKWRILNSIAGRPEADLDAPPLPQHSSYQGISSRLRARFAEAMWRASCGPSVPAESKDIITQAFRGDTSREHLHLSFRGSHRNFGNTDLQRLALVLPPQLRTLRLDLGWCWVGRSGTAALGEHLPSSLKVLSLTFEEDMMFAASSRAPPSKKHEREPTPEPAEEELARRMYRQALSPIFERSPRGLQELTLSCRHCDGVDDEDLKALGKGLSSSLRKLDLTLEACKGFSDEGMKAVAVGLPKRLKSFRLNMPATMTIGEASAVALVKRLPEDLEHLFMSFYPGVLWRLAEANGVRLEGKNKIKEWRAKVIKAARGSRACSVL